MVNEFPIGEGQPYNIPAEGSRESRMAHGLDLDSPDGLPADVSTIYGLDLNSPVDAETYLAFIEDQLKAPERASRDGMISQLRDETGGNEPGQQEWTEDMAKIGIGSQNVWFGKESVGSNIPDPANPGFTFDAKAGSDLRAGGQQLRTDTKLPRTLFKDKIFNPRAEYVPQNLVNHYPTMLSQMPTWIVSIIKSVAIPVHQALLDLQEAER